jgi:hypothetical protein
MHDSNSKACFDAAQMSAVECIYVEKALRKTSARCTACFDTARVAVCVCLCVCVCVKQGMNTH